jgi:hypothetical protein
MKEEVIQTFLASVIKDEVLDAYGKSVSEMLCFK